MRLCTIGLFALALAVPGCDYVIELPDDEEPSRTYTGPYASEVQTLLGRVSGWTLTSCATCSDGVPPQVAVGDCQRDHYVAAAVQYAWAAASYANVGNPGQAEAMAREMHALLQQATALCSDAPSTGGSYCRTLSIWPC